MGNTATALNDRVVNEIFRACLHCEGDNPLTSRPVQDISYEAVRFSQARLDNHRNEIHELVSQLHDKFREDSGASFANIQINRNGARWTTFEQIQERLVQLGVAIDEIEFVHPRRFWPALYKGMPLLRVKQ